MRILVAVLLTLAVSGCTADKYTETPKATGPWSQANSDPDSTDNNIVPLADLDNGT
jgi:hypothetical protein